MNKRIKELAKDYLVHERFTTYGESIQEDYYEMYPDELAEFAELIINECAKFARQYNLEKADRSYMIHEAIKQQFGVEDDKTA